MGWPEQEVGATRPCDGGLREEEGTGGKQSKGDPGNFNVTKHVKLLFIIL